VKAICCRGEGGVAITTHYPGTTHCQKSKHYPINSDPQQPPPIVFMRGSLEIVN
jgi:hypothetical protein